LKIEIIFNNKKGGIVMKLLSHWIGTIACIVMLVSSLLGGVHMKGKIESKMSNQRDTNMEIFAEQDRLRIENTGGDQPMVIIFRADLDKFWIVEVEKNKATEITKQDMQQMMGQMDMAMKMMEDQMKNMSKEEQEMMKKYMQGKMPGQMGNQPKEKKVWKKIGNEKVVQWTGTKYDGYEGSVKTKEMWTVEPEQLGLSKSDFQVFESAQAYFKDVMKDSDSFFNLAAEMEEEKGFSGFPVKVVSYHGDTIQEVQTLEVIEKRDNPDSLFELDKNVKIEESPLKDMKINSPK
jgi:hypothetical protein